MMYEDKTPYDSTPPCKTALASWIKEKKDNQKDFKVMSRLSKRHLRGHENF